MRTRACRDPVFDPATYYTDAYFEGGHADGYADYAGSEAVLRQEFNATITYLSRFVPSGRLLEIGCAYGFFLLEAQRRFDVAGIEIAPNAVRVCHRLSKRAQVMRAGVGGADASA